MKVDSYGKIEMTCTEAELLLSLADKTRITEDQAKARPYVIQWFRHCVTEAKWRTTPLMAALHDQTFHCAMLPPEDLTPEDSLEDPEVRCMAPCPPDASLGLCERLRAHEGEHWASDPSGAQGVARRWEQWEVPEKSELENHSHEDHSHSHNGMSPHAH